MAREANRQGDFVGYLTLLAAVFLPLNLITVQTFHAFKSEVQSIFAMVGNLNNVVTFVIVAVLGTIGFLLFTWLGGMMRKYSWNAILQGFKVRILRQRPQSVSCEEESIFESSKWMMTFEGGRNKTERKQPAAGMSESNSYEIRVRAEGQAVVKAMDAVLQQMQAAQM
jgi:hypothetical protein